MVRWEPGARGRLMAAALDLFTEQGFEKTTAEQIANRAGMNRRTFFHHFRDKREVVFGGEDGEADQALAEAVREQPQSVGPLPAALAGLRKVIAEPAESYPREGVIRLGALIASTPELQERELTKRAHLADQIATVLRERGTPEGAAAVTARTAVAVFSVARNRWNQPDNELTLAEHMDAIAAEVGSI